MTRWYRWVVSLLLIVFCSSCSGVVQEELEIQVPQVGETVVAGAKGFAATQVAQLFPTQVADQENEILARARIWIDNQVPYSQTAIRDGYRTDCSGFVSYAWQLPTPGPDTTLFVSGGYAIEISIDELQPGDALNNNRPGNLGHIVLFVRWLDEEHSRFEAYDMNGDDGASVHEEWTLEFRETGWTIAQMEITEAKGPYFAQRLNGDLEPFVSSCLPDAVFVTDVSIPDGTVFSPNEAFSKVWRIRSSGCSSWPNGTRLVFVNGNKMDGPDSVEVAETSLGSTVDVAVSLIAPVTLGTYKGYWQMQSPDGTRFGDTIYVMIVVR